MLTRKGEMTNVVTDDDLVENYSNLLMEYALESGHEMIILKKDNICQKILRGNRHWFDKVLQKTNEILYRDYGMKLEPLPYIPVRPFASSSSSNSLFSSSSILKRQSISNPKFNNLVPSDSYILCKSKRNNSNNDSTINSSRLSLDPLPLTKQTVHPNPSDLTLLFIILSIMRLKNKSNGERDVSNSNSNNSNNLYSGNNSSLAVNLIKEEDLIDILDLMGFSKSLPLLSLREKLNEFKRLKYLNIYKRIDELGNQILFYGAGARAILEIPLESLVNFTLYLAKTSQYNLTDQMAQVAFGYTKHSTLQESLSNDFLNDNNESISFQSQSLDIHDDDEND